MLAAIGFNADRNFEGNRDDGAGPNSHGLVGGQQVLANHCRAPAYGVMMKMKMEDIVV